MFDRSSILEGAALNPAPGLPSTIGERASIDAKVFAETSMSMSAGVAIESEYQKYIEQIEDATGRRLLNPMMRVRMGSAYSLEEAGQRFAEEIDALREATPGVDLPSPSIESVRADIAEHRAGLREQQADITRRTVDWPVSAAGHLATMGTAVVDPPILMSMAFGAPYASGILRGALIEAGIAAGVEVPVQTAVQLSRRQFGEEPSFSEGLAAVAAAGGGGFLFSAALRSLRPAAHGTRALLERVRNLPNKRAEVRAAEEYLARKVDLEDKSPFPDTPRAREEHELRMSEAERAVREGRPPDIPEKPAHPVRATVKEAAPPTQPEVPASQVGRAARQEALDKLELDEAAVGAVDAVAPLLDDPAALAALYKSLRAKPKAVPGLLDFLRRNGGIRESSGELANLGITNRTLPGLLRKEGRPLDDATLAAWEEGFFPGHVERPTTDDLLDLVRQELHGQKVVRESDLDMLAEQEALQALDEGLTRA
ncbi:MAG: hypothetical protein ACYS5V_07870, partial [Planctomycetota bacterium]